MGQISSVCFHVLLFLVFLCQDAPLYLRPCYKGVGTQVVSEACYGSENSNTTASTFLNRGWCILGNIKIWEAFPKPSWGLVLAPSSPRFLFGPRLDRHPESCQLVLLNGALTRSCCSESCEESFCMGPRHFSLARLGSPNTPGPCPCHGEAGSAMRKDEPVVLRAGGGWECGRLMTKDLGRKDKLSS